MIITGVRLCGRHLQLRRLLICNCEKLSISARLMQRLHHWPHQLPAGSELIRLLLLMGQRRRRERKGAALSINVPAAPRPSPRTRGAAGQPRLLRARGSTVRAGTAAPRTALGTGAPAGTLQGRALRWEMAVPMAGSTLRCPREPSTQAAGATRAHVHVAARSASARAASGRTGSAVVGSHAASAQVGFVSRPVRTAAVCLAGLPPQGPPWRVWSSSQLRSPGAWRGLTVRFACPGSGPSVTGGQASPCSLSTRGACCACGHQKQSASVRRSHLETDTDRR